MEDHLYIKSKGGNMKKCKESKDIMTETKAPENKKKISQAERYTCSVISGGITACALHDGNLDLVTVLSEITKSCSSVVKGKTVEIELMLMSQAKTLDILFNRMLVKAVSSDLMAHFEKFTEIALKAQNQSRQTLAALGDLKHPRRATFIKQQNNAHNQQVNNNCTDNFPKKSDDLANELLKEKGNEALDFRRAPAAIEIDRPVVPVAAVHRPKNGPRKGY